MKRNNVKLTPNPIPHMVRRMPRQMHHPSLQPPHSKHPIILQQQIKHAVILAAIDAVPLPKQTLHLPNPLPDPHGRLGPALLLRQPALQVERGRQMVGVGVRLEDVRHGVAVGAHQSEQGVGGVGGHGAGAVVVVEDGVDDGGCVRGGVGDEVLPGRGLGFEDWVDRGFRFGSGLWRGRDGIPTGI